MPTRRTLLRSGGVLGGVAIAGCVAGSPAPSHPDATTDTNPDGESTAFASLFPLAEFARAVGGDAIVVEEAVETGAHGHEWEPSMDLLPRAIDADAFVYLDVDRFQPWAEDIAERIDREYADDVLLIDVLDGIDLLRYDAADAEVAALDVVDLSSGDVVADAHHGHWHGGLPAVSAGGSVSLGARFVDQDGDVIPLESDTRYELGVDVADDGLVSTDGHGDHVHLYGETTGETTVVFQLLDGETVVWESPPILLAVVEGDDEAVSAHDDGHDHDGEHSHDHADDHGDDGHSHDHGDDGHSHDHGDDGHSHDDDRDDHDHGDDHSHGEYDAKFYADPVLAQEGVRNVRDGFVDLDPDNADYYRENAVAYIDRLQELHERFERRLADREHDVIVLAGHDSFQYLGERYGFRIHTPVGLSPDHDPTPDQIAEAVELIESEGIEYVLWDYFDGDRAAEVIAAEVDHDVETEMIASAESTTQAWLDEGIGSYVDQLEQITLPALETALGADGA